MEIEKTMNKLDLPKSRTNPAIIQKYREEYLNSINKQTSFFFSYKDLVELNSIESKKNRNTMISWNLVLELIDYPEINLDVTHSLIISKKVHGQEIQEILRTVTKNEVEKFMDEAKKLRLKIKADDKNKNEIAQKFMKGEKVLP